MVAVPGVDGGKGLRDQLQELTEKRRNKEQFVSQKKETQV
jgi:hypothetical protein